MYHASEYTLRIAGEVNEGLRNKTEPASSNNIAMPLS